MFKWTEKLKELAGEKHKDIQATIIKAENLRHWERHAKVRPKYQEAASNVQMVKKEDFVGVRRREEIRFC